MPAVESAEGPMLLEPAEGGSALIRNIKLFEQWPHLTPPPLVAACDQIRPTILQVRHERVAFARTDARHAG